MCAVRIPFCKRAKSFLGDGDSGVEDFKASNEESRTSVSFSLSEFKVADAVVKFDKGKGEPSVAEVADVAFRVDVAFALATGGWLVEFSETGRSHTYTHIYTNTEKETK